jgi:predicted hotdog family 3-hydroxylacyl-ACP dehydratase
MNPVNARPYIPQQPPIVMVDSFLVCNEALVTTLFRIPKDHIFVQNGQLSAAGLMENIAQTCATRIGWLNREKPVKIGVIGSINRMEINSFPLAEQTLETRVDVLSEVFDATIVKAEIKCNGKLVAQGEMKVFVTEQNVLRESEE